MKRRLLTSLAALLFAVGAASFAAPSAEAAGITAYQEGDKYLKLGGRIQVQYHLSDTDDGPTTDSLFLRRFRPYIEGSIYKDWKGKFEFDMGKASGEDEMSVKDAYFQYSGLEKVTLSFGNKNFPFSREKHTSSNNLQLIERTFVGDHDYGTPDRQLGLFAEGKLGADKVTWEAAVASASIDPGTSKLDFDTPVNKDSDFNEGWIFGGRVDYHPFGLVAFSQGDFDKTPLMAAVGVGAFIWNNDGDNNASASSVESVTGFEVSGAVRYMGASVDAQFNIFKADAEDTTLTSGIYRDGTTDLKNFALKGGYMVLPPRLELAAGFELQDADNYAENWTRTSLGVNYFIKKHDIKLQATYRIGKSIDRTEDKDVDELFAQAQYNF